VDYADIMSYTQSNSVGWMVWSWSGNGSSDIALDMVTNFDNTQPTTWGNIVFTGANGLSSTSKECSIYGGTVATNTPVKATATFTRTPTQGTGPTATRTRTPTTGPTATRTNTPVPGQATATRTPVTPTTPPTGGACSPVTSTITAPFTYDGAGTFCWQSSNLGSYINSWNLTSLTVNGVSELNVYVASGSLPAKISGYWYVSYNSTVSYGHFEAK